MPAKAPDNVSIGKFDILATYTYARALLDGLPDNEARERGMVVAVLGARARSGGRSGGDGHDHAADRRAAEKKHKSTITAASFDRQVSAKMGPFFVGVFLPAIRAFVAEGLSYDEVKRRLKIPATWGAKITGAQFRSRAGSVATR